MTSILHRRAILSASCLLFLAGLASNVSAETPQAPPKGLRVLTAGHSFHAWMPAFLTEMAANAQITGHQQIAISGIGASQVIKHWNVPDDKNQIKSALIESKADVLTLSGLFLPDAGYENFVKLGLEHNPSLRITVQEFWLPWDDQSLWDTAAKGVKIDQDGKTIPQLREAHAAYFKSMDELVGGLNTKFGKTAVFVVPVGQAVIALREKILKGEAPGIAKQSELFADTAGHPLETIKVLASYCHFAVIYGRNPVGLAVPTPLAKRPEAEKLNRLLQELAWDAVTRHPLSGVKVAAPAR
ncbi:MAG: hypothetical protein NTW19_15370 [Planctomycetota bacterium]|nr:hypothetical protein [Planctomycetota bacterium]